MNVVEPGEDQLSSIFTSIHHLHHSVRSLEKEKFESQCTLPASDIGSISTPIYPLLEISPAPDRLVNDELLPLDSKRADTSLSGRLQHATVVAIIQIEKSWPPRCNEVCPLQKAETWMEGIYSLIITNTPGSLYCGPNGSIGCLRPLQESRTGRLLWWTVPSTK